MNSIKNVKMNYHHSYRIFYVCSFIYYGIIIEESFSMLSFKHSFKFKKNNLKNKGGKFH